MNHFVNLPTSTVVHDDATRTGARIPSADLHARRIAREAERWIAFATERTRMRPATVLRKGLDACAFSVQHRASSLAVPSKLGGTREHQRALWTLVRDQVPSWAELAVEEEPAGGLVVTYEMERLGEVQPKHVPWLRPLVPFGVRLYLARVTGHEREGYWLGCNVVFGHVGAALAALNHALGGDGGGTHRPDSAVPIAPAHGDGTGDGASGDGGTGGVPSLTVAQPERVAVLPEAEALSGSAEDVVLFREIDGTARATVPHVVRHSPTGIEWGYGGSGPADLARSILLAFTDEATADAVYQRFKADVVAHVPEEGGVIPAAQVRRWLAQYGATAAE